ncbi:MAG: 1-phosphofructokinase [Firmicutes bacterium]|nr:1-phosphofructokinase [Bacillota bacterium]
MVYTVTFNPAIDYYVRIEELKAGSINRAQSEELFFGGKGINVSLVLAELGVPSRALGFVAGFTGKAIRDGVSAMGIETDFVELEQGCSRINVKISSGVETEINGQGPKIPAEALNSLYEKLDGLQEGDTLVLAGSIPGALPADIYEKILARLSHRNVRTAVDATGELLLKVLKYRPFLVKPNRQELGGLFGVSLHTEEEIVFYGEKLREMGAENVLISLAGDGAILLDEQGELHRCGACEGKLINSVGAGDSMVAGFLAGFDRGGREYALKLGTAAGGATAFSHGLAKKDRIYELLKQM